MFQEEKVLTMLTFKSKWTLQHHLHPTIALQH